MHWFWRAVVAVVVSFVVFTAIDFGRAWFLPASAFGNVPLLIGLRVAGYATPVLIFGLLTRWCAPDRIDPETRCRKCGYILRGISEPRCPECGERI